METAFFLIDPSDESIPRDSERFKRLVQIILNTEIREFYLVSRRPAQEEVSFLEAIPEKRFEKKGLINRLLPERLQKQHLQTDQFEMSALMERLGHVTHRELFFYFEDDRNDLAYDGQDWIWKLMNMAKQRGGSSVGMRKIAFSDIPGSDLLKGNLVSEGEYQIRAVFRGERALQSSSNLALTKRFLMKPDFIRFLSQNRPKYGETAFIESLNLWARSESLYGSLSFQPLKIK
ncbi:MAG: hypothetical protein HY200_01150 [Nitrospirae bacterium]|nr:hypothetical protein [Nitrospirota bacterium]MBI3593543.1 hypothetical protein [Nitrospirota bacterium]